MLPFMHSSPPEDDTGVARLATRDGVEIEKGVVLTETYLEKNYEKLKAIFTIFSAYPDLFLDLIKPTHEQFSLFFYQRIFIRACMRYKAVFLVACRAFSKSFVTILAMILQCIFLPGTKRFICAPHKNQAAQIAKEKIYEIYRHWPLLRKEVQGWELSDTPGNFGKDYVTIKFTNGSQFDVVGAAESSLGGRRQGGLIDEIKNHDEEMISTVVLPLLNVSRRLPDNTVNPKEPNQQVICCTSAWLKSSFAYARLIDDFENAIIDPQNTFVMGCDYRVPLLHGLLDKDFINKLRMSPSFNEESFATEYLSRWRGGAEDAWFNYDKLQKYRKIKNPESKAVARNGSDQFYLLSMDCGRYHDQSPICVFRVNIRQGRFYSTLVNLVVIGRTEESKVFSRQAADLKHYIELYNPREVVIDTNGVGAGFADFMIQESMDGEGHQYPPYGFFNDDNYKKTQPKNCAEILYSFKANSTLKSKIHGNCYSRLTSGMVHFLIKENEAKSALLSTKIGQKMTTEQRVKRLMPHEMTTKLFEEMGNMRLRRTGAGLDIVLEPINTRLPDDKYMAFAYGLWRIKELEEEYQKKRKVHSNGLRQLVYFTGGRK